MNSYIRGSSPVHAPCSALARVSTCWRYSMGSCLIWVQLSYVLSPLSAAVILCLLPVLVVFSGVRAFSHARMFLSVFAFSTARRQTLYISGSSSWSAWTSIVADFPLPRRARRSELDREDILERCNQKMKRRWRGRSSGKKNLVADGTNNIRCRECTQCYSGDGKMNDKI